MWHSSGASPVVGATCKSFLSRLTSLLLPTQSAFAFSPATKTVWQLHNLEECLTIMILKLIICESI